MAGLGAAAGNDVILLPLPLFHVYGNVGVQALAFINRNPLGIVPNPRDIPDLIKTIRRVKPAFFNGVPTLYIALLNHPEVQSGKVDFKSIKICLSGAAPLLAETKARFESITGGRMVEGYSLTEAMMALLRQPGEGPQQARLGRHAAARRPRANLRRRGRGAGDARRRGRRDRVFGAAADERLLEPSGGDRGHPPRARGRCRIATWLHTATSGTSTRTATSLSSTARRI